MLTNPWSQECDKFSQVALFTMKKKNTFDKAQKYCWEETGVCMCYWCVYVLLVCVCVCLVERTGMAAGCCDSIQILGKQLTNAHYRY